jgi:hypothetical protein
MARTAYSFRLQREVPLLNEAEWAQLEPLRVGFVQAVKDYSQATGRPLQEARETMPLRTPAIEKYLELTGVLLDHPDQLFAIRMRDYGAPCPQCHRPFRTPKAKLCADCGYHLPSGKTAGPLTE